MGKGMRMNRPGTHALRIAAFFLLAAAGAVRATGFLTLESSPTGAEVWYTGPDDPDKKYLGDTPLESRELPVGRYNLWLILPSHDTLALQDVYIAEGQVTQLNREIPTHYGYLEVATDPDSSEIWLDGVRIGPSPYVNNLVLPGTSKLKAVPRESHFKNSARNLNVGKGDSINITLVAPYRDKNFGHENLSLPEWRFQVESGLEFRSWTGNYLKEGKRDPIPTDSADLPSQWDFPIGVRLGLPQNFEVHLLLPFKSSRNPQVQRDTLAVFRSNMTAGVKYTYRPLNLGLDLSYGFGFKTSSAALDHDFLALTLLAAGSKGKIYGQAQAGFEFHFASKVNNKFNPGDVGFAHVQVGYLVDPFTPYLGASAQYRMDGTTGGKSNKDLGYVLIPEPGFIVDLADMLSFQFGVPFTIIGKNYQSFWGLHLSLSLGLTIL